jgi:hypothetical protein
MLKEATFCTSYPVRILHVLRLFDLVTVTSRVLLEMAYLVSSVGISFPLFRSSLPIPHTVACSIILILTIVLGSRGLLA